ncbi:MAG: BamA/TamA family outer membrane protein, partial [Kiloniellaceae bacterium]
YTLEDQEILNVDENASILVKEEEGRFIESRVGHELNYDTRDNRFDPHEGFVVRLRNDFAGLGGDVFFFKSSVGGAYYYPITESWTASTRGEIGNIFGLGQDTRITDRKFVGGRDCRGFQSSGIGPRDRVSDDPLGGKNFYTASLELGFPLGLPDEFDIRGRIFTDACAAWGLDSSLVDVQDESAPRVSVGGGISWNSPFGPIVVDLGLAVIKEDFDQTEVLNFNFGTQF